MIKISDVNIGGFVFHVNEDAYGVLKNYLDEISQHFTNTESGDEIISDIEARIVEIFQQKLSKNKEVITIEDVNKVISILGNPSEFGDNEENNGNNSSYKKTKRLFRDIDNGMIGGVCAGLGAYFNLDTVWFRIGFIIATFSGLSLLAYIILWAIIPPARTISEKLEMQGDPVTVSNIEKSIREEMSGLRDKFDDLASQARNKFGKKK